MSENIQVVADQASKRKRRPRSPTQARPAFVIVQILDERGNPVAFDKKRLKIIAVERSAEKVMEQMEDGTHPHALYLRIIVPAGSRTGQSSRPREVSSAA
jgi:hypothetical protein